MDTLNKISMVIERLTDYFLIIAFAFMTIVYSSSIFARFVLNTGVPWAEELTRFLNVAVVMLGSASIARHHSHINISVLELMVSKGAKKYVLIFQQIVTVLFFGAAAIIGFNFASTAVNVSPNMRIPMSFMYNLLSVAFVLLAFQGTVWILNALKSKEGE